VPAGVLGAALVVRLLDEWWSYLPAGIVDDLHRDLHVDYAGAGWLLTLLWVGGFIGDWLGLLADHVNRRTTAVTGALLLAAGLGVYALGAPYIGLAVASMVMGAASDLIIRPIEAAVAGEHGERLDRVLGWQHTLSWIGDLIGPLLLGLGAATSIGWRGAFAITAFAMVLFAAYLAVVRFPAPPVPAETRRAAFADVLAVARRRDVLQIAAAELLLNPLDEPFLAFVVARAAAGSADVGSRAVAQLLAAAVVAGGLAGSVTVARRGLTPAVRRIGPATLFVGAALTPLTRLLVIEAIAMALVGAGMALAWAAIHHRMLTVVPGRTATVSSVVGLLDTPALIVPVVVGVIADHAGLTAALTIYVALAGALVLLTPTLRAGGGSPGDKTTTIEQCAE
jgi:MFS family permease